MALDLTNRHQPSPGRLIALEPTDQRRYRSVVWRCLCDCGAECLVPANRFNNGEISSCGCLLAEARRKSGLSAAARGNLRAEHDSEKMRRRSLSSSRSRKSKSRILTRLREVRTALGLTSSALACRCNMDPSSISRIERGHVRIGPKGLARIALALGISVEDLT